MRTVKLPVHGIELSIDEVDGGRFELAPPKSITCSPDLYETCFSCGSKDCCYACDGSTAGGGGSGNTETKVAERLAYNGAVDGIMSMILAHAITGIDVESPAYLEGIETALQAAGNNL